MASAADIKNLKSKLDGEELDLSFSDLSVVPVREIAALKKVSSLDLARNKLVSLPDDFCNLRNLVKIDLSSNKLRSLPEQFGKLENLQQLDLYQNELQTLPLSFAHLKNLRWLDVKDNPLEPNLKKQAGDCLNPKQCTEAAHRIVKFMQQVLSERDREKQKELKKQRETEAAEKAKEDDARNAKAAEKKKEKEKRKQAGNVRGEAKHEEETKESNRNAEKRAKVDKGSAKKEKQAKAKKRGGILGCIGCLFWLLFVMLFVAIFVISATIATLYFNCSQPSGKEFIPKTRPLCQDLYQIFQTGRLAPFSWNYKATLEESGVALQNLANSAVEWFQKIDWVEWKNVIITNALAFRDNLVRWSIWLYENGSEYLKPVVKQLVEWFWVAFAVAVWALQQAFHYVVRLAQWAMEAGADIYNNFPSYLEKVKFYWKNLK